MRNVHHLVSLAVCAIALSACGQANTTAAGMKQVVSTATDPVGASGINGINPAKFEPLPFKTLNDMHRDPKGSLRKSMVGKRVQVDCVALYVIPGNEYTGIRILLASPSDPKKTYIQPINVTPGLFYFQSHEKKQSWLEQRGFQEDTHTGKPAPPVTFFAQVLPSDKDRNEMWPRVLDYLAVRRADGRVFSL